MKEDGLCSLQSVINHPEDQVTPTVRIEGTRSLKGSLAPDYICLAVLMSDRLHRYKDRGW
jgi:hypothetical protein